MLTLSNQSRENAVGDWGRNSFVVIENVSFNPFVSTRNCLINYVFTEEPNDFGSIWAKRKFSIGERTQGGVAAEKLDLSCTTTPRKIAIVWK
ncbi:hypothetical protein RUM43_007233 [Polyplax serrata]|uniref:Uncharacterized protein n=1 Tax=Polyplax serrata TaxID=468196 RepID=A0AAN8PLZ3_POLSC